MSISLESVEKINALKQGIETVTGETYNDLTTGIQALKDNYATEEQIQAVNNWDLINDYFANYTGSSHHLFNSPPKDAEGNALKYRLPYIYTPKMVWSTAKQLTNSLIEVGIDVSNAQAVGVTSGTGAFSSSGLQRLVMTGNANAQRLNNFMNQSTALEYIKLDTPSEGVLKANERYYNWAFHRCEKLQTIDCELDFSYQTSTSTMFAYCYMLKNLRIKPFTLSTSIDFGDCQVLHFSGSDDYESLISILNSITSDKTVATNMTLTLSNSIKDNQNANDYWDKTVYLDSADGIYYSEQAEGRTEYSLYNAFLNKGVTIAWK